MVCPSDSCRWVACLEMAELLNFGFPLEADESLSAETFPKFLRAVNDALTKMTLTGERLVRVRIWKGRLVAVSDKGCGYVYLVQSQPCPNCPKDEADSV